MNTLIVGLVGTLLTQSIRVVREYRRLAMSVAEVGLTLTAASLEGAN